jgi:hypothetical protein
MLNIPWRASVRAIALAASVALIASVTAAPAHSATDAALDSDFTLLTAWADTTTTTETDYALVSDANGLHRFDGADWTTVNLPTAVACADTACTNVSFGRVISTGVVSVFSGTTVALYNLKTNAAVKTADSSAEVVLTLPTGAKQITANTTVAVYQLDSAWYSWAFADATPVELGALGTTLTAVAAVDTSDDDGVGDNPVRVLSSATADSGNPVFARLGENTARLFGAELSADDSTATVDSFEVVGSLLIATVTFTANSDGAKTTDVYLHSLYSERLASYTEAASGASLISATPNGVLTGIDGAYSWYPIENSLLGDPISLDTTGYAQLAFVANAGSGTPIAKYTDSQGVVGLARLTSNGTTASLTEITHLKVSGAVTISGEAVVGQDLSANTTSWTSGATLTYQWLADGAKIDGANADTYSLTSAEAGKVISVQVTGTKTGYETAAVTSDSTAAVTEVVAGTVSITGTAAIGQSLSATLADWPAGATFTYEWLRGTTVVGTAATYTVTATDAGNQLSVRVTASVAGQTDLVATSEAVSIPAETGKKFTTTPRPVILGSAQVNHTLVVYPGLWRPVPVKLSVQWYRDGVAISGATKAYYRLVRSDRGARITVAVTGTKSGYVTTTVVSKATSAVR